MTVTPEPGTAAFDELVLTRFPYPIAVNYQALLNAPDDTQRTLMAQALFRYGLRTVTLGLMLQYLVRDLNEVSDPSLDSLLSRSFRRVSDGTWVAVFFATLRAYRDQRHRFFVPSLYDIYWDTSTEPHRPRKNARDPFQRLVELRNDMSHGMAPRTPAEWHALATRTVDVLRQAMSAFVGLAEYDLVRVVNVSEEEYACKVLTGLHPHTESRATRGRRVRPGWFYLRNGAGDLLDLHPLFVLAPYDPTGPSDSYADEAAHDAAMFEQVLDKGVEYIATVLGTKITREDDVWSEVSRLIEHNLKQVKMGGRDRVAVSWDAIRTAAEQQSEQHMAAARVKFQERVYLQREGVLRQFHEFLASAARCFILVGASGVGKTNFVLALQREFADVANTTFLLYDSATLDTTRSAADIIATDLDDYIQFSGQGASDALDEITASGALSGKRLVAVFDAVNENPNAGQLIRSIDTLVRQRSDPWLKIVITSRPESWAYLSAPRDGWSPALDRYYRDGGTERFAVEIPQFAIALKPFERDEVERVFDKYREVHGIVTEYSSLAPATREALRDPLVMALVTAAVPGGAIPADIDPTSVVPTYVDHLRTSGRLEPDDLRFLEFDLVVRMLARAHYGNHVPHDVVATADDGKLWDRVCNGETLSSGQPINAGFRRLVDAGILARTDCGLDSSVRFTYERFYEYFGGRRLARLAEGDDPGLVMYTEVGRELETHLYLWGALVRALREELAGSRADAVVDVVASAGGQPMLESALVEAITQLRSDTARQSALVQRMVGAATATEPSYVRALAHLVRGMPDIDEPMDPRRRIGIEAASRIGAADLIATMACEPSSAVRTSAIQHTFYLWTRDRDRALDVLDHVAEQITDVHGLPQVRVAESMLAIVGAVLSDALDDRRRQDLGPLADDPTLRRLHASGRSALRRLLLLDASPADQGLLGRSRRAVAGTGRRLLVDRFLQFALGIIRGWDARAWASMEGLEHVFSLSRAQKELLLTFTPYLSESPRELAVRLDDIVTVEDWGDMIAQAIVEHGMIRLAAEDLDGALDLAEALTDRALASTPPRFWTPGPLWNFVVGALRNPERSADQSERLQGLVERATVVLQRDRKAWAAKAQTDRPVAIPAENEVVNLGGCIWAGSELVGRHLPSCVEDCLRAAVECGDDDYLELFVHQELNNTFETGARRAALLAVAPIQNYAAPRVRDAIVEFIVRARRHDPELVEEMLIQGGWPNEIVDRVRAQPIEEGLADLASYQMAFVVYDLFVVGPPYLREEYRWIAEQALQGRSFTSFAALAVRELLNGVAGELVFRVPESAPSRRTLGATKAEA